MHMHTFSFHSLEVIYLDFTLRIEDLSDFADLTIATGPTFPSLRKSPECRPPAAQATYFSGKEVALVTTRARSSAPRSVVPRAGFNDI